MKYLITESQYNKAIDKFITYKFEPHEEKTTPKHPNSIFWVKDGKVVAEIGKKNSIFWVEVDVWRSISSMFSLGRNETEQLISLWLEEHYSSEGLTPMLHLYLPRR